MNSIADIINFVFPYDGVYEVILGTTGKRPNLAPIGVIKEGNTLKSKIYKETITFQNLLEKNVCSINIVLDSKIFFDAFFGTLDVNNYIENVPILGKGIAFVANVRYEKIENPTYFFYKINSYRIFDMNCLAFNRGNSMLIDLLVHISRLDIYNKKELEKYLPIIKYEIEIIKRTMPERVKDIEKIYNLMLQKGLKI